MCRITVAWVFKEIRPGQRFEDDLTLSVESILGRHWKPELRALLENVAMDGAPMLDLPEGRMFHPGHAIESAWMLMEIARQAKRPSSSSRRPWTSSWPRWSTAGTQEYGGIRYLTNIDWTPTHELEANLKLWWVALRNALRLLLGWSLTGREDLWQWYEKVHD